VMQIALILVPLAVVMFLYGMATGGLVGGRPRTYVVIMLGHVLITPLLTYPCTKTTWIAFDLAMGGLEPHEQREAEQAVNGTKPDRQPGARSAAL